MYTNISEELRNKVTNSPVLTTGARLTFENYFDDGEPLIIDNSELTEVKLQDDCYYDGNIVGNNIAKDLEITIINKQQYDLENREFKLELGILLDNNNYEYIPYGNFIIDTVEDLKSHYKFKLQAMDYMVKFNKKFEDTNTYPMSMLNFRHYVANFYGVQEVEVELANDSFIIQETPYFENMTGREVLRAIAQLNGVFVKINRDNKLEYVSLRVEQDTPVEAITAGKMNNSLEIDQQYGEINVVMLSLGGGVEGENVTRRDEESIEIYGENILNIEDNPFVNNQDRRELAIDNLFHAIKGFKYTPTTFNYTGRFWLDSGDRLSVQDTTDLDKFHDSILLQHYIEVPKIRSSKMENKALTKNAVNNQYVSNEQRVSGRTEAVVDKANQNITLLVQRTDGITEQIAEQRLELNSIKSSVGLLGGNNLQRNSIGAYGTKDFAQSETGTIVATEEELLKSKTDNGFGRIMYLSNKKWFKFRSEILKTGNTYTLSFKYTNTANNHCIIKLINNTETTIVDTLAQKNLENVVYTFIANTEYVELYVETGDYTMGITDYYLQLGSEATKWQSASGEMLSTSLEIYYNGIKVRSADSEIITNISNLGFTVENVNGKILITFNKDKCILSDTEVNGTLEQNNWLRYVQNISNTDMLLEVKI